MAGMRTRALINEEGLWFEGADGISEYISVKVDRQGLNRLLAWQADKAGRSQ